MPRTPGVANASSRPRTSRSSPGGATRNLMHAPPTPGCGVSCGAWTGSPSAAATARSLRSTPSAARQSSASWPPPTRAETFARSGPASVRRTCGVSGLDGDADVRGLDRCGPAVHERHAERRRRRLLAIGDREGREAAVDDERVDGDDRADELLDEAVLAVRLGERVRGGRCDLRAVAGKADTALARAVGRLEDDGVAQL